MRAQIVPAEEWHIPVIAARVRPADRDELFAIACYTPERALAASFNASPLKWTGLINGEPVCMFGVAPGTMLGGTGRPWLISSQDIENNIIVFLKKSKVALDIMTDSYPLLENYVDARNTKAIKWLKWLSFCFDEEPIQYGVLKMPFYRFYKERGM